jgi:hypothetical protein
MDFGNGVVCCQEGTLPDAKAQGCALALTGLWQGWGPEKASIRLCVRRGRKGHNRKEENPRYWSLRSSAAAERPGRVQDGEVQGLLSREEDRSET